MRVSMIYDNKRETIVTYVSTCGLQSDKTKHGLS